MQAQECFHLVLLLGVFGCIAHASPAHPLTRQGFHDIVQRYAPKADQPGMLQNEDAFLTVPEIIRKYGYPAEEHEVITEDGYILTVHRIPYGIAEGAGPAPNKPAVWLQHGLLGDSSNWIMNTEEKALAYTLVNLGYDVWMGNARGNTYSRRHVSFDPDAPKTEFWKWSWHEMGIYDVPAVLNHILTTTGQPDLYYVGHSMGTTMFWVAMSMNPALNDKIRLMSALAPVAYFDYAKTPLMVIAPLFHALWGMRELVSVGEFLPNSAFMKLIGQTVCQEESPIQELCSNVLFLMAGYNTDQLNTTALPIIFGHTPSGSSTQVLVHYAQIYSSGIFRQIDYGKEENLEKYGSEIPPSYDFNNVKCPVGLYWGANDWLASERDAYHIAEELPQLVRKYRVRHDKYNHLDFLWALDNQLLLNNAIVQYIQKYEAAKP